MKNKLYILGIVIISLVNYSCSNEEDDFQSIKGLKNNEKLKKFDVKSEVSPKTIDSVHTIDIEHPANNTMQDGDPSNPVPPRPESNGI